MATYARPEATGNPHLPYTVSSADEALIGHNATACENVEYERKSGERRRH